LHATWTIGIRFALLGGGSVWFRRMTETASEWWRGTRQLMRLLRDMPEREVATRVYERNVVHLVGSRGWIEAHDNDNERRPRWPA
jgi:hypothetical protein